jgi:hypothetical protein
MIIIAEKKIETPTKSKGKKYFTLENAVYQLNLRYLFVKGKKNYPLNQRLSNLVLILKRLNLSCQFSSIWMIDNPPGVQNPSIDDRLSRLFLDIMY